MINVHDTNGEILDPNPRLCGKTGYDASELTDMKIWELDREIDPDATHTLWQEMGIGENRRIEGRYERADGSTFPVEVHISRFRFEGQDRSVAIARDITERKERDRTLEKQQTIVETAPDPIAVVDVDGRFRYVNPALCDLTGYTETSLLGRHFSLIKPDEETSRMEETFERVMSGAKTETKRSEALLQTASGESRICEDHVAALPDGDTGRSDEVVVIHRDVTERVNRERELAQRKDRLDEVASIVSHDLRNPLKTANGRLELAMEDCDSEHLAHVDRALDRMGALTEDLLTLARSGDTVADHEPVDFEAVAKDCWRTVGTAHSTLTARADRMMYADRSRLKQVFENLIRNAVEHGGDDVTVTVGELDNGFYVEDDGPGIPEERRDEVFSAGYSTSQEGTGFGLSIVRQIAEAHGWDVRVTDGADGGARFEFANVMFEK
ncbi:PAS domain S-box protein [Haloplanus sp.]|uniref:PAS domain S-box protein n=1 Tax=Haloplanus sp. TaxID=1961696 RepID=UPI00260CB43C|nr:PAS domain S-box protein [Haloplanus sp.]